MQTPHHFLVTVLHTNNDRFKEFALCSSHHPGGEGEGRKKKEEKEHGGDEVPPLYIQTPDRPPQRLLLV